MLRLTKRMEDGSYQANNDLKLPGENSHQYKNMIIERCGKSEDLINGILIKTQIIESGEDEKGFTDWIRHELSYYGFIEPLT